MAFNQFMHPRNRYKDKKPDFAKLAEKYPEFAKHVSINLAGNASLDFHDPESLRALTCTLLKEDFGLSIELPLDRLIPTVPLRLNYIHWIEDLLQESGHTSNIYGIDIGCGASCIYPLLGSQMNGWCFAASEIDELALQYACDNVKRNSLQDHIKVFPPPKDTLILGVFKSAAQSLYHFTMCNPPFFGNLLEAQGIMSSRTLSRPEPKSVSTASEVEMIYEEGGEVDFVKRMIMESQQLREQIVWYTSMLGKKSSLGPLREELMKQKIRNFTTTEFCQGRTMRWGIAWTFYDDIAVPPPSKRRKFKQRPPLVMSVPDSFVEKAVTLGSTSSNTTKGHAEKVQAVANAIKQMMKDLQISYELKQSSRKVVKLECTALTNTWAHQRRKRRQKGRMQQDRKTAAKLTTPGDAGTDVIKGTTEMAVSDSSKQNILLKKKSMQDLEDMTPSSTSNSDIGKSAAMSTEVPMTVSLQIESQQSSKDLSSLSSTKEWKESGEGSQQTLLKTEGENLLSESKLDQNPMGNLSSSAAKEQEINERLQVVPDKIKTKDDLSTEERQRKKPKGLPSVEKEHPKSGECLQTILDKTKEELSADDRPAKHPSNVLSCDKEQDRMGECVQNTSSEAKKDTSEKSVSEENLSRCSSLAVSTDQQATGQDVRKCTSSLQSDSEPLFKCALFVKMVEDKVSVELSWLDGSNREAMHQVGQYIRNHFTK